MNLNNLILDVVEVAKEAGSYIKSQQHEIVKSDVEQKGLHDFVTFVDKEAEKRIVDRLKKLVPQAGFIVEENQALRKKSEFNWIIDPLDGTTNFIHSIPFYSVSIALAKNDELILGAIYEINRDECFYAWKDGGSWLDGKHIRVSSANELNDSLIATGFPYADYSLIKPYLGLFEEMMRSTRGIRRLGSAAVDLAYIACGRFDLFYEYSLNPWDVAAGIIIVKEAGGRVTDFKNEDDYLYGRQIIASNSHLHNSFIKCLQKHFRNLV